MDLLLLLIGSGEKMLMIAAVVTRVGRGADTADNINSMTIDPTGTALYIVVSLPLQSL